MNEVVTVVVVQLTKCLSVVGGPVYSSIATRWSPFKLGEEM